MDETSGLLKTFFKRVDENEDGFLDKVELDALAGRDGDQVAALAQRHKLTIIAVREETLMHRQQAA